MKVFRRLLPLFLLASLSYAAIPIDGLYGEVFGGYSYEPNNLSDTFNNLYFSKARYRSGYHGGGRFGYKDNPLRYEGEVFYTTAAISRYDMNYVQQTLPTGNTAATAALLNVYYDFPQMIPTLAPFLSAGLGYAYISSHLSASGPTVNTEFRGMGSAFAYQGSVGIGYYFVDNYSLDIAYRYFATTNVSQMGRAFQAHMASAGATYRFDGGNYR